MSKIFSVFPILILVLSIFGYPIAAMFSQLTGVENSFISIAVRSTVVAVSLLAILFFLKGFVRKKRNFFSYFLIILVTLFFSMFFIRAYLDGLTRWSDFKSSTLQNFWLFLVGVTFIPTIASAMSWRYLLANNDRFCTIGVYTGLASLCLMLYAWSQQNIIVTLIGGRIEFDTLNPISIGHAAVSALIFAFCYKSSVRKNKTTNYVFFLFVLILGVIVMLAAGSRGPIQSLVAVCLFYILFSANVKIHVKLIFILVGFLIFLFAYNISETSPIAARMTTKLFDDPARIELIRQSVATFSGNLFSGAGIMSMETYPHNLILESFVILGFVGGSIFLILSSIGLIAAIYVYSKKVNTILPFLFIQYFVAGLFSGTLHEVAPYWITLCILLFVFSNFLHFEYKFKYQKVRCQNEKLFG